MKNFIPIQLGKLVGDEERFAKSLDAKRRLLSELFAYMGEFISIDDKHEFKSDIYGTFLNRFLVKHKNDFPSGINANKLMELMNVNINKLNFLIDKIEDIKIDLDYETSEPLTTPDFGIYTETEKQNKEYHALKLISDAVTKASKNYEFIKGGYLQNLTSGGLFYNNESQTFEVNHTIILRTNLMFR